LGFARKMTNIRTNLVLASSKKQRKEQSSKMIWVIQGRWQTPQQTYIEKRKNISNDLMEGDELLTSSNGRLHPILAQ
jgi:hypothetical protein